MSSEEEAKVLALLRKLYRQGGSMVCHYQQPGLPGDSGPVEKYVIRALRQLRITEASEQLLNWMADDGKKAAPSVRWEMWSTLAYLGRSTITAKDMEGLIRRGALVELWAVTPPSDAFDPRGGIRADIGRSMMSGTWYHDEALSDTFNQQLVSQLANPDPNVGRGVVRHLADQGHAEGLLALARKVELTRLGKEQVSKLLEEEFAGRRKDTRGTEAEALEGWASELLEALGCDR